MNNDMLDTDNPQDLLKRLLDQSPSPEVRDVITRSFKSFIHAIAPIAPRLTGIKGIQTAEGAELVALITEEALKRDPIHSKRTLLKLQGHTAFHHQLHLSGGAYSTSQVADLLKISAEAVRKRVSRGKLLAIQLGDGHGFPVWQFDDGSVVQHFDEILGLLKNTRPVGAVQFFITENEVLGKTPIDALKQGSETELETVRLLARQWRQHIAR